MLDRDCDYVYYGFISGPEAHDLADDLNVMVQERNRFTVGAARVYRHKRKYSFGSYTWQHLNPEWKVPERGQ